VHRWSVEKVDIVFCCCYPHWTSEVPFTMARNVRIRPRIWQLICLFVFTLAIVTAQVKNETLQTVQEATERVEESAQVADETAEAEEDEEQISPRIATTFTENQGCPSTMECGFHPPGSDLRVTCCYNPTTHDCHNFLGCTKRGKRPAERCSGRYG
jgi:hypothetical protein